MVAKLTEQAFVKKARQANPKINLVSPYEGLNHPIRVGCPKCSKAFTLPAAWRLYKPVACDSCKKSPKLLSHEEFVSRVESRYGKRLSVLSTYEGASKPVTIRCDKGHAFTRAHAGEYLTGTGGCRQCADEALKWTETKLRKAMKESSPTVRMQEPYKGHCMTKHRFKCLKCTGEWMCAPSSVLHKKSACPVCAKNSRVSNIALAWLEREARRRRIVIEHGGNVGEQTVPGTRFKVDGINWRSRTVFEFYGDAWHGNPKLYKPSEISMPQTKMTAGQLYARTLERERKLKSLGYKLVTIWESDFRAQLL